jgi:hypothetical protein
MIARFFDPIHLLRSNFRQALKSTAYVGIAGEICFSSPLAESKPPKPSQPETTSNEIYLAALTVYLGSSQCYLVYWKGRLVRFCKMKRTVKAPAQRAHVCYNPVG